ncbi:hypothetical protein CSUI_004604 [Cystoisospora suis]|uniref:Uncharacterized protein n=1 Tax=Cystoisospora suis TaxID=483139 RepID=A0A2C6KY53_9APIC|nr:hypothetical protein CSUI_004604 [Cystoisospora suis]
MTTQLVFSLPFVGARSPFSSSASCSLRMLFLHINTLTSLFSLSHLLLSLSFSSYYDCPFSFARASSLSQDGLSLANFEAFPLIQYDITSSSYGVKGEGRQQRQVEESPLLLGSWGLGRLAPMNTGLHATTILTRDSVSPQTPESEKEAKSTISDSAKEEKEKEEEQKEDTNREIPLSLIQDCVIKRLRDGSLSSKKSLVVLRISEISLSLLDFLLSKSLNLLLLLPPSPSHSVSGRSGEEENERKKKDRHEEENVSMEEGARIEDKKRRPHLLTKKAKEEEEKMTGKIHEIEQYLLHRYLPGLCLFAVETLELSQVYRHLQQRQREKMISHQEGQLFYQRSSPFHPSNLLEKTLLSSLSIQRIPPPSFHPFASYLQQAKRLTPFQIHGSNLFAWLAGKKITDKPQSKSPSHTAGGVDEQPGISRTHFSSSSSPPPAIALVANYDAFAAAPVRSTWEEKEG